MSDLYLFIFRYVNRYSWVRSTYKAMLGSMTSIKPLNSSQKKNLKKVWGKYASSKSFLVLNQYIKEDENLSDYVPLEYFMFKLEPYLNKYEAKYIDDKNFYDLLFPDIKQPKTVLRQVDGVFLDEHYNVISKEKAFNIAKQFDKIIIKEATSSVGGHGISFWKPEDGTEALFKKMAISDNMIAQEVVKQHEIMSRLNKSSINTLRIASLFIDGEVHIITQFVRMGCEGSLVDNVSSGGMYCGIDDSGRLKEYGYDHVGRPCKTHGSGTVFNDIVIPNYEECIETVKRLTPRMSNISKLQSWDIAISEDGKPLLIEPNLGYPDILVNQIACGPLFGTGELKDRMRNLIK